MGWVLGRWLGGDGCRAYQHQPQVWRSPCHATPRSTYWTASNVRGRRGATPFPGCLSILARREEPVRTGSEALTRATHLHHHPRAAESRQIFAMMGRNSGCFVFKGSETRWPGDNKGCRTWFTGLLSVEEGGALLKKKITIINAFRSVISKLPNLWWNICHFSPDNLKILWVIKLSNKIAQILLECQAVFFCLDVVTFA